MTNRYSITNCNDDININNNNNNNNNSNNNNNNNYHNHDDNMIRYGSNRLRQRLRRRSGGKIEAFNKKALSRNFLGGVVQYNSPMQQGFSDVEPFLDEDDQQQILSPSRLQSPRLQSDIAQQENQTPQTPQSTTATIHIEQKLKRPTFKQKLTYFIGVHEWKSNLLKAGIIEFIDFNIDSPVIQNNINSNPTLVSSYKVPITIGVLQIFILGFTILACGPSSGGHLNPVFTITTMLSGFCSLSRCVVYVVMQLVGSIVGSAMAYAVIPYHIAIRTQLGGCSYGAGITNGGAVASEFMFSFFNLFIAFGTVLDPRQKNHIMGAPFIVSLCLAISIIAASGISGTTAGPGYNIARCFGPAVIIGNLQNNFWPFVVGPLIASFAQGVLMFFLNPVTFYYSYTMDDYRRGCDAGGIPTF
ncbi:hypothetical protein CYY_008814 [Polysphondylium violaceum]|uniref:Aquaporin-like protein n=1 Tax=Polysphondylium violaceum TaxID=133409 RepID=A0A8J4PPV4_9MYCE|nr:hypothetical protein CYY_008814 [Polysphondylium violaceum]